MASASTATAATDSDLRSDLVQRQSLIVVGTVESESSDTPLIIWRPRHLPADEGSRHRWFHSIHRLEERARSLARHTGLLHRRGLRTPACPLLALEGAPHGIRANVVNPDAVLPDSRIWQGEWAQQRAAQNKTTVDDLKKVYRERSLLKRSLYPEDIAEAVTFFASDRFAKSTGNILNVDAGNAAAFTR